MKPRTLILRTAGTNCTRETAHAFELAGATATDLHINVLLRSPKQLSEFQILALPGGFSYGDDIAAGRIYANQLRQHLFGMLRAFVDAGKPIIGICNGFQVLVKTGLLPGGVGDTSGLPAQTATLAHNENGRFVARWVHLSAPSGKCVWTRNLPPVFELPIAHGEGRFVVSDPAVLSALHEGGQIAAVYTNADGSPANGAAPANPNGSTDDIAGLCDPSGLVFGLMPHPERYISPHHHPAWSSQGPLPSVGAGLKIFQNAVEHARNAIGAGV